MNKIIKILYKPVSVFNEFDNLYEEDLDTKSNLIASIYGFFVGLNIFILEFDNLSKIASGWGFVIICIFCILLSLGIFVLVYNYFFTYILYWVGRVLGSQGGVADTRIAIVYSALPIMLSIILDLIIKFIPETLIGFKPQYLILWSMSLLMWIWTMIILVSGLKTFNKYGVFKAIINVLPLPAIGLLLFQIKQFVK